MVLDSMFMKKNEVKKSCNKAIKNLEKAIESLKSWKGSHGEISGEAEYYINRIEELVSSDNGECGLRAIANSSK